MKRNSNIGFPQSAFSGGLLLLARDESHLTMQESRGAWDLLLAGVAGGSSQFTTSPLVTEARPYMYYWGAANDHNDPGDGKPLVGFMASVLPTVNVGGADDQLLYYPALFGGTSTGRAVTGEGRGNAAPTPRFKSPVLLGVPEDLSVTKQLVHAANVRQSPVLGEFGLAVELADRTSIYKFPEPLLVSDWSLTGGHLRSNIIWGIDSAGGLNLQRRGLLSDVTHVRFNEFDRPQTTYQLGPCLDKADVGHGLAYHDGKQSYLGHSRSGPIHVIPNFTRHTHGSARDGMVNPAYIRLNKEGSLFYDTPERAGPIYASGDFAKGKGMVAVEANMCWDAKEPHLFKEAGNDAEGGGRIVEGQWKFNAWKDIIKPFEGGGGNDIIVIQGPKGEPGEKGKDGETKERTDNWFWGFLIFELGLPSLHWKPTPPKHSEPPGDQRRKRPVTGRGRPGAPTTPGPIQPGPPETPTDGPNVEPAPLPNPVPPERPAPITGSGGVGLAGGGGGGLPPTAGPQPPIPPDDAQEAYRRSLERERDALEDKIKSLRSRLRSYSKLIDNDPNNNELWKKLLQLEKELKDAEQQLADFDRLSPANMIVASDIERAIGIDYANFSDSPIGNDVWYDRFTVDYQSQQSVRNALKAPEGPHLQCLCKYDSATMSWSLDGKTSAYVDPTQDSEWVRHATATSRTVVLPPQIDLGAADLNPSAATISDWGWGLHRSGSFEFGIPDYAYGKLVSGTRMTMPNATTLQWDFIDAADAVTTGTFDFNGTLTPTILTPG